MQCRLLQCSHQALLLVFLMPIAAAQKTSEEPSPWRAAVMGTNGMVAAEHPLQARAGLRVLEQGGNAIDAAVAMFYMTSVTEQHQAGLGGDAVILAYLAGLKKVVFIKGTGTAPKLATAEFCRKKFNGIPLDGPFSTNVPGSISAFDLALKKYGSKKYDLQIRDSIETAEKGHPLSEYSAAYYASALELIRRYPSSSRALLRNDQPLRTGEVLGRVNTNGGHRR